MFGPLRGPFKAWIEPLDASTLSSQAFGTVNGPKKSAARIF
jgi:hypothetical protein